MEELNSGSSTLTQLPGAFIELGIFTLSKANFTMFIRRVFRYVDLAGLRPFLDSYSILQIHIYKHRNGSPNRETIRHNIQNQYNTSSFTISTSPLRVPLLLFLTNGTDNASIRFTLRVPKSKYL